MSDTGTIHTLEEMIPLLIQVQRDLDQELDLEALAKRFGYSVFHFHRLFKENVGETPRQYVQRLRLEKAAYKLMISAESILDISLATGFKNHETFARAFRKRFACTPSSIVSTAKWPRPNASNATVIFEVTGVCFPRFGSSPFGPCTS